MSNFLICIPTYNECESIIELLDRISRVSFAPHHVEILVIDDNSPDGTAKIVDNFSGNYRVHVLRRATKEGLGPAYLAGFAWGLERDFDFFVECDADGSHQPEELNELIRETTTHDLVLGTRWMKGGKVVNWPAHRKIISRVGTFYAQKALKLPYRDLTGGYRIFSRKALTSINFSEVQTRGYGFQIEMAMKIHDAHLSIAEVPITFVERAAGKSKMNKRIVVEALIQTTIWGVRRRS